MEIEIDKNYNVKRLRYWLNYNIGSMPLYLVSLFYVYAIIIFEAAAIIFTPFMLKILFEEKKWGWIIFFVVFVLLPIACIYIFTFKSNFFNVLKLIPLVLYYVYCSLLRLAITDWLV